MKLAPAGEEQHGKKAEAAEKLERSFSTVNAYVCNRSQPNLTTLLEIAQFLSVDMKELITDKKERND